MVERLTETIKNSTQQNDSNLAVCTSNKGVATLLLQNRVQFWPTKTLQQSFL